MKKLNTKNDIRKGVIIFTALFVVFAYHLAFANSNDTNQTLLAQNDTVDELKDMIDEKNEELKSLEKKRAEIERKLRTTTSISNNLQGELRNINYQINQLEISIRSNNLAIEKLGFEINSLKEEIKVTESKIKASKSTIASFLVQIQQIEDENILTILLKNDSLSDSVSEIQSIMTLNNNLIDSIEEFRNLKDLLVKRMEEIKEKKENREIQRNTLVNRQSLIENKKGEKEYLLDRTQNQEEIYRQKIEELDKQQDEISKIITEIEEKLRNNFDPDLLPVKRPGVISTPLKNILVTQCYGNTEFAKQAYRTYFHTGMDFSAGLGTALFAADDGIVVAIDNNDRGISRWNKYQYGKYIMIKHENNLSTFYAHLSQQVVTEGQRVKRGELIGYTGNTGYSTGPHLHFGVYWTPSVQYKKIPPAAGLVPVGVTINPADYMTRVNNIINCVN